MSEIMVGRVVAVVMLISLGIGVTVDTYLSGGTGYSEVNELAKEVRSLGQPFLFFSISSLLGVVALVVGAVLYLIGRPVSRMVLAFGAVLTFVSIPMTSVHVYSTASYAADFVFVICLGWLLATPCKSAQED